jgi:hypothetical protein
MGDMSNANRDMRARYKAPILLKKHKNLYMDFFAGLTAYNPGSGYTLDDYVPLIMEYADRFLVGSDSGYDVGYDKAYKVVYELFDKPDHEVV